MFPLGAFYYLKLPRWREEEVCQASLTFVPENTTSRCLWQLPQDSKT